MTNIHDDVTLKLYRALRELSTTIYMDGLENGLKAQMSDAMEALEAAQILIDKLEPKEKRLFR